MPHPVIHAGVLSEDPDATCEFFAQLFDWKVASEGGFPATRLRTRRSERDPIALVPQFAVLRARCEIEGWSGVVPPHGRLRGDPVDRDRRIA
jgi:hypothetical protein